MYDKRSSSKMLKSTLIIALFVFSIFTPFIKIEPVLMEVYGQPPDWWDSSWAFRKTIIIDHTLVSGNQVDFPVLIDMDDFDQGIYLIRARSGNSFITRKLVKQ